MLRVTQAVADGFQRRQRTVMVLVDFSRAFDKTWKTGILYKLAAMGLPRCLTAWIRAFLTDRQACVKYNGQCGRFRCIREGTPQGAVCSPTLFLAFINDLPNHLPRDVETSLFADDLAIWATDKTVAAAEARVQRALDCLLKWAEEWKMEVNREKTVGTIFTLDPAEARRECALTLGTSRLQHDPTPVFLGIRFDRGLSFRQHIENVKVKMKRRSHALRSLSGKSWGAAASDLRTIYLAFIRSCADYAAGGWMAGVAASNLEQLEVAQRQACRTITGCLRSTPAAALEREADLMPFHIRRQKLAAIAVQRHLRDLPGDHLQSVLTSERPRLRLHQDRGWADTGLAVSAQAGLADLPVEPLLVVPLAAPWESHPQRVDIRPTLLTATSREDPPETRLAAAEATLDQLPTADVTVYTDGSATGGTEFGGGGAVILRGDHTATRIRVPAGRFTSSYRAEIAALDAALEFLQSVAADWNPREVRVCTDSQSALSRLAEGPVSQTEVLPSSVWLRLSALERRGAHITLQWVPGHAGLPGNEQADELARGAATLDQSRAPVDLASAKGCLRRHAHLKWTEKITTTRYAQECGTGRVTLGDRLGLTRKESVEVARLRTGHSLLLRSYRLRIGLDSEATCQECDEEDETLHHLLTDCPARALLRREVFGRDDPTVREALTDPRRLAVFLRRLGRL